jgi:hypothetical protein|nr:MAG TPA: minor capsid component [Caudoviricetes sp.]
MPAVAHRYFGAMHQSLSLQYAPCDCEACQEARLSSTQEPPKKPLDLTKVAKKAFDQLYKKGAYKPEDLTKYKAYRELITATSEVFNTAIPHEIPEEMRAYLERDVFVFSGLKTHTQLTEARSKLKDEQGNIRPYHLFEKEILGLNNTYNRNYLEAEYQFAVQSAQSAANWANLQEDTSRYWLEYRTTGDERVRQSHASLAGICLPKDDAFWTEYYPPNGWRCRCTAVEVLARENTKSNPETAKKIGEEATTQIGKNGNNKLAMFRFNPGQEKKVFPPNNTYTQVVGAEQVKRELETITDRKIVNLQELIRRNQPTKEEVEGIMLKYAELFPEDFRRGLGEVSFTNSPNFLMQHSMSYRPSTNEWIGKSTIEISNHTFAGIGFNASIQLREALGAIKKGEDLTFMQEYAIESLWHEILHAKTQAPPIQLNRRQIESMETINEFIARHTYNEFIERLRGKAIHQQRILEEGYGYKGWINNFRERLKTNGISEEEAVEFFKPHLMNDYSNIGEKIIEFFAIQR